MKIPWYLMAKGKGGGGYKTASGPIVSINDALAAPLRSLRIAIDPVQDLHGYDAPWPGGGGKNKLAPAFSAGTTKTANDVNYLFNSDGTVSVSGTCSDTNSWQDVVSYFSLPAGTYTLSGGVSNSIYLSLHDYNNVSLATSKTGAETFTLSETTTVRVRACVLANTVVPSNTVLRPMLESGSTATTYSPYSNLCPISGWTEANLWRTGKNLLDPDKRTQTSNNIRYYVADGFLLKSGQTYTLTVSGSPASALYFVRMSDNSNIALKYSDTKLTYTPTEDVLVKCNIYYSPAPSGGLDDIKCQLELSSTPTPYTPYTGTTIPVTWSEAGTVYGGVWDVLNGVLKKTWGMAILANRTWTMETTANGNVFSCNLLPDKAKSYNQMCSKYKAVNNYRNYLKNGEMGTYNATNGRNRVSICDNAYSTVSDFVNGLAGVDYIYELATPLEYTLTPQQLDTLAGQNVVWADAGDVTVEYLASGGANADLMKLAVAFMGRK